MMSLASEAVVNKVIEEALRRTVQSQKAKSFSKKTVAGILASYLVSLVLFTQTQTVSTLFAPLCPLLCPKGHSCIKCYDLIK